MGGANHPSIDRGFDVPSFVGVVRMNSVGAQPNETEVDNVGTEGVPSCVWRVTWGPSLSQVQVVTFSTFRCYKTFRLCKRTNRRSPRLFIFPTL